MALAPSAATGDRPARTGNDVRQRYRRLCDEPAGVGASARAETRRWTLTREDARVVEVAIAAVMTAIVIVTALAWVAVLWLIG